jgi:hypothetical protein
MTKAIQVIAEKEILMVPPVGVALLPVAPKPGERGIRVNLRIGLPQQLSYGISTCEIHLDGFNSADRVHGASNWQALFLAISLMRSILKTFDEHGWLIEAYLKGAELEQPKQVLRLSIDEIFSDSDPRKV